MEPQRRSYSMENLSPSACVAGIPFQAAFPRPVWMLFRPLIPKGFGMPHGNGIQLRLPPPGLWDLTGCKTSRSGILTGIRDGTFPAALAVTAEPLDEDGGPGKQEALVRAWEESGIVSGTTVNEEGPGHGVCWDPDAISWREHLLLDPDGSWRSSLARLSLGRFLISWFPATTEHRILLSCGGFGSWSIPFHPLLPMAGWSRIGCVPNQGGLGQSLPLEEQG